MSEVNVKQMGTTVLAPDPAINFPTKNGGSGYGKKTKSAPVHGGDQYGVTLCKSEPAVNFPNSKPAFSATSAVKRGY